MSGSHSLKNVKTIQHLFNIRKVRSCSLMVRELATLNIRMSAQEAREQFSSIIPEPGLYLSYEQEYTTHVVEPDVRSRRDSSVSPLS